MEEMEGLIHARGNVIGIRDERRYEEFRRAFIAIANALPAIGGGRFDGYPLDADEIAEWHYQTSNVGEFRAYMLADQAIYAPRKAFDEYRFRFNSARRDLVRERIGQLTKDVDGLLLVLVQRVTADEQPVRDPDWIRLKEAISEIERLAGDVTPRKGRWSDMKRHLSFGQGHDVHDIASLDWPSVRSDIDAGMYSDLEPLPIAVEDLGGC